MTDKTTSTQTASPLNLADPSGHLQKAHEAQQTLLNAQPALVQRFLEAQAQKLAEALTQHLPQVSFTLPDKVVVDSSTADSQPVPPNFREQLAGGLVDRLARADISAVLRQRLAELEQSPNRAIAVSASLLRHATAVHMVQRLLPAGRSVTYSALQGEEIPTVPVSREQQAESALTAPTDAIAEESSEPTEAGRGELIVPYVPAARRFYLPQWVAFGDEDRLLVNSTGEAEAQVTSMQRFLAILHAAFALAPYIVADETYQQKRYGMLGQLVNQGRALARHQAREIIEEIKRRAAAQELNRGLSLSLPYFDDQTLELKQRRVEVIPAGRIMFVPAFMVRAAREEQVKVAQDTRLSPSTRKHLLVELQLLEQAFGE